MSVKTVSLQADAATRLDMKKEGKLLVGFAIPCIISMLVRRCTTLLTRSLSGQGVGLLGNAATNICVSSLDCLHSHCAAARYRQCDEFQSPARCRQ